MECFSLILSSDVQNGAAIKMKKIRDTIPRLKKNLVPTLTKKKVSNLNLITQFSIEIQDGILSRTIFTMALCISKLKL